MGLAKNRLSRSGKDNDAMDVGQAEKADEDWGWEQGHGWGGIVGADMRHECGMKRERKGHVLELRGSRSFKEGVFEA